MKKYVVLVMGLVLMLAGCQKEKEKEEYNMTDVNASINIAKELSETIVSNKSFEDSEKVFKKYEYLMNPEIYHNNFDLSVRENKYTIAFNLDDRQYIAKNDLINSVFGITKNKGEYAVYLSYKIIVKESKEGKEVNSDIKPQVYRVDFEYTFNQYGKIIKYNMKDNYIEE